MTTRLPSKKTGNGRHKQIERGVDLYPTPAPITQALLQVEPLPRVLWEPAAGMGHMSDVLAEAGHAVHKSDLVDYGVGGILIRDFFDFDRAPDGATCVVSNPPFVVAGEFVRHGLKLCDKVCVFGRLAFLESAGREDLIDGHLARVYPIVERCMLHRWSRGEDGVYREWAGKKSESAMAMSWFVFLREKPRETTLRRIWINPKNRETREDGRLILVDA